MRHSHLQLLVCLSFALTNLAATARAAAPAEKEWTLLVFLNGHNNLDSFGAANINQMEQLGSTDKINIVVQWASLGTPNDTKRLYVKQDHNTWSVTSPVVEHMGKVDMGDYHNLSEFIQWGVKNYPAKHIFVDVWDHGSGWHPFAATERMRHGFGATDISWDDTTGNFITTKQLGLALNESAQALGRKIDIYGSDACLMAMVEVAAEMRDSVDYFVGSQELEPGAGWPYHDILAQWSQASQSPSQVVGIVVDQYVAYYDDKNANGTMSAFDMSGLGALNDAIVQLGDRVHALDANGRKAARTAAGQALYFYNSDYRDLMGFVRLLATAKVIDQTLLTKFESAYKGFVVANCATASDDADATGISIWLPCTKTKLTQYKAAYETLDFETQTAWLSALTQLLSTAP